MEELLAKLMEDIQEWLTEANRRAATYSPWDVRDRLMDLWGQADTIRTEVRGRLLETTS